MQKNLMPVVTIISPCYNGEAFVHRLLDSVITQTYSSIELIVIDDGSTDGTKFVVERYHEQFQKKGMILRYYYQENAGQAEAINRGLQMMTGDYLTWIDSDDFLMETSIEKRVNALEVAGAGHFCITACEKRDENNLKRVLSISRRIPPTAGIKDEFFLDLILERNIVFASGGGFMLRTDDFLKAYPSNYIYPSREGQNWQLMLPITYHFKCIYVEEPLYAVLVRTGSHSRQRRNITQEIQRNENFVTLLTETIKAMKIPEENELIKLVDFKYMKVFFAFGERCGDYALVRKKYLEYCAKYGKRNELWWRYISCITWRRPIAWLRRNAYIRMLFGKTSSMCS